MKKKNKILVGITVLILGIVMSCVFLLTKDKDKDEILYREYQVTRGDIIVGIDGFGSLKLEGDSQMFENEFIIEEIMVSVGEEVKENQQLAKLSVENIDEQIKKLTDDLKKSEDTYNQVLNNKEIQQTNSLTSWQDKTNSTKAIYESKKSELDKSISNLTTTITAKKQRITELEELIKNGEEAVPIDPNLDAYKKELVEITKQLGETETELSTAIHNLELLNSNRQTEINAENESKKSYDYVQNESNHNSDIAIDAAKREVDRLYGELSKVNKLKKDPYLYAGSQGIVTEINYKENVLVDLSSPGIVIGDINKKEVLVSVDQNAIIKIEEGQKVEVQFSAYGDTIFYGTVKSRDLVGKNKNGTIQFDVYVEIDSQDKEILPEMTCSTKFISKEVKDIIKLSNKAIQLIEGIQYVDVKLTDGTIERREIKTGFSDGKTSEIIEGLSEGDVVVVES
ncbi:efflux RND transporter periplasmic adaptor subunit [Anaerorhabdus sp.]|uniref:efflux RND transporter periplasmic adaptor subunit n=1 Tax=Anaerorhabdus sp. TaxID=1872524 RepID=UPI002FCADEC1